MPIIGCHALSPPVMDKRWASGACLGIRSVPGGAVPVRNAAEHRPADWYELFFDLVFVVVTAVSAEVIEKDPAPGTMAGLVLLFFPLWWAWANLMITNNLYGRRYPAIGVLTAAVGLGEAHRKQSSGVMRDVVMYFPFLVVTSLAFVAAAVGIAVADARDPLELEARGLLLAATTWQTR